MAAAINAGAQGGGEIVYPLTGFPLAAPGQLILHHHFRYFKPGFHAPVQQVARSIDRERQIDLGFGITCVSTFFYNETTSYRIVSFRYSCTINQKCLEGYSVRMIG